MNIKQESFDANKKTVEILVQKKIFKNSNIPFQGFAEVSGNCDKISKSYVASFKKFENVARRKNRGLWQQSSSSARTYPPGSGSGPDQIMSAVNTAKKYFSNLFTR